MTETKPTNPKDAIGVAKTPVSTVPIAVVAEVGLAMGEGGLRYGRHNYRPAGVRASVYVDAVWRHLFLQWWETGEDIDAASGLSHVTKAIAGLCVLRDSMIQGNFEDDRPPRSRVNIDELNANMKALLEKYPEPVEAWTQKRLDQMNAAEAENAQA